MDLEVFGRHALFFDDDSMAAFVNSSAALVEWNDLLIDRYDVRHLLSSPPPRPKRRRTNFDDPDLESELEHERYLDLPAESSSPLQEQNDLNGVSESTNVGGFTAVPFSYGSTSNSNDQKNADTESDFHPPFPVPESLLLNLPPTEKLHQIIARTASFVSKHGGQSEIVLRVKQGGNPTFGFLMPDHNLHPYFRFLVEHQELLTGKSFDEDKKTEGGQGSGALSLLGSIYGTGEDEDTKNEPAMGSRINEADTAKATHSNGPEGSGTTKLPADRVSNNPIMVKDKAPVIKSNPSACTVNDGVTNKTKKNHEILHKVSASADNSQLTVMQAQPKFELPVVEPPADMKRVIDKIVEFILRNGREFEAILAAQDVKFGRFPFLLPASLYHAYYRKVLQETAEESKTSDKGDGTSEKHGKRNFSAKEHVRPAVVSDTPDESAANMKSKMVIGKLKQNIEDEPPKPVQSSLGVTVDVDAAAAILQAARRGIKNPNLGIFSRNTPNESSQGQGSDNGYLSSQPSSEQLASGPAAKAIARTAAKAAASEGDSSEASLSNEQKRKAERLKRAKMFMAMLKSGAHPTISEPACSLSIEPPDSGISASGTNALESLAVREKGDSLVPAEAENEKKPPDDDDNNGRRSKRNYRSRCPGNEDDEKDEEEGSDVKENKKGPSRKRRSHHSGDEHNQHKRRHSRDKHKHDNSSDDERHHRRPRHKHKHSKSSHKHELDDSSDHDDHHHRHRSSSKHHKHLDTSDDGDDRGHRHRHRSSKYKHEDSSEDDEHDHRHKDRKRMKKEKRRLDEERVVKPDQSKTSGEASIEMGKSNREGSNDPCAAPEETTQVSDELRAKIRAMLAATL